jgi:dolichol-phosphate mannosyltransferase
VKLLHAPLISIASKFRYTDTTNGFRGYSSKFIDSPRINIFREIFKFYELHYYLAIQAGVNNFNVIETPVIREYPFSGKVPTKIKGIRGNLLILKTLFLCVFGFYNLRDK